MAVDEERVMENIIKVNLESLNQRLRLFAKVDITIKQTLKLLCSKSQSAFRYFENTTLENNNAFSSNAPKIGIFLECNLVKSALAFSINENVSKIGIVLMCKIENPNAKIY